MNEKRYRMISWVAEKYEVHPQTLRLWEREGLLAPARSKGNTRLYDDEACERLETIIALTRDLGINLAGVEVILNLRAQLEQMQTDLLRMTSALRHLSDDSGSVPRARAIVCVGRSSIQPVDE